MNRVFVWWLCWAFLCGLLACCIAGIVTANRFGFSLNGIQCAYERIYYDIIYGQIKQSYPKWEGREKIGEQIINLNNIKEKLENNSWPSNISFYYNNFANNSNDLLYPIPQIIGEEIIKHSYSDITSINNFIAPFLNNFFNLYKISEAISNKKIKLTKDILGNFSIYLKSFDYYKSDFMSDYTHYVHIAFAMGKILPLIYFSVLLTFVVASGALLITYYCKKRNHQWWILTMHIAWNGIRFFIFSFFIYGCAFGMLFLGAKDGIAYLKYAFGEENLFSKKITILPKETQNFFKNCLFKNSAYEYLKENNTLNEFIKNAVEINSWIEKNQNSNLDIYKTIKDFYENFREIFLNNFTEVFYFQSKIDRGENIYDSLNCSFINYNINLMYRALWDFSGETRILCALSCCIGFFGEIAVYSFLWVMKLWRKDDYYQEYKKPFIPNNNKVKHIKPPQMYNNNNSTELKNSGEEEEEKRDSNSDKGSSSGDEKFG